MNNIVIIRSSIAARALVLWKTIITLSTKSTAHNAAAVIIFQVFEMLIVSDNNITPAHTTIVVQC